MFFKRKTTTSRVFVTLLLFIFAATLIPAVAVASTAVDIRAVIRDDNTGNPIQNARLDLFYQNESIPFISTYSDHNGRVDTTIFASRTINRIEISRTNYSRKSFTAPVYTTRIDLGNRYLVSGTSTDNRYRVSGTVTDSRTRDAVADARILLTDAFDNITYSGYSNSRGNFEIDNIPLGDYEVLITRYGYESFERSSLLRLRTGNFDMGTIELRSTGTAPSTSERMLTGRITDESGDFVQLAEVYLIDQDDKEIKTTTDSRGYYTFNRIDAGTYTIGVNARGYELIERINFVRILTNDREREVNLVIRRESRTGYDVYGRVTDEDRNYLEGVEVSIIDGNTRIKRTQTDDRGYYEFRYVPDGRYTIEFKKIGYQTRTLSNEVRVDGRFVAVTQTELTATQGNSSVIGGLVGDSQTGLRGLTVYLENQRDDYTATTNFYGYFTFTDVREGVYDLYARISGEKRLLEKDIAVRGSRVEIGDINVNRLASGYKVSGTVTDSDNLAIDRVRIELTSSSGTRSTSTDSRGNYEISGLERGRYTITASKDAYNRVSEQFEITSFDMEKDFRLRPNDYVKITSSDVSVAVNETVDMSRFISRAEIFSANHSLLTTITSSFEVIVPEEYRDYLTAVSGNQIRGRKTGTAYVEISIRNSADYDNLSPARVQVTVTEERSAAAREAVLTVGSNFYVIDGKTQQSDATPYLSNNRSFFPIRVIAAALGVTGDDIKWDSVTNTVTLIKGNDTIEFTVGRQSYRVNGVTMDMDVSPENLSGRVYLPARFVTDAFGGEIEWDNATKSLTIISN